MMFQTNPRAIVLLALIASGCFEGQTLEGSDCVECAATTDTATPAAETGEVDADGDGYSASEDCNDADASINPGVSDVDCDGVDQNCDGVDGPLARGGSICGGVDSDGDGYLNVNGDGAVVDCDDENANTYPGAAETCDGEDNDCDDLTDEDGVCDDEDTGGDTGEEPDADSDGDPDSTDCDPDDATIYHGATETCNGSDDDCDGETDEDCEPDADSDGDPDSTDCDPDDATIYHGATEVPYDDIDQDCNGTDLEDVDCDGYGHEVDCDDSDDSVHPTATETCNGIDDDCDGETDESDATDADTWYFDADGDGYGDSAETTASCAQPTDYVDNDEDCDDSDDSINPDADETCNGIDDDCDGEVDEELDCPEVHELCVVDASVEEFDLALMIDGDTSDWVTESSGHAYVASPFLTESDDDWCATFEGGWIKANGYSPQSELWHQYISGSAGSADVVLTDASGHGSVLNIEIDGEEVSFSGDDLYWSE